jgi:hypothetical protein
VSGDHFRIAKLQSRGRKSPFSGTELMNKSGRCYLRNISAVTYSDLWLAQVTPGGKQFMATRAV